MTDAATLVKRLARCFDLIPHLAYVAVGSSIEAGESTLVLGVSRDPGLTVQAFIAVQDRVSRQALRIARRLGAYSITIADWSWGPPAWSLVIYRRAGLRCWEAWAAREGHRQPAMTVCAWSTGSVR